MGTEVKRKSKMPQIGEGVFSIIYLLFGFIAAFILISNADKGSVILKYGILTLVLALGDSFHLVPRIRIHRFGKFDFRFRFRSV